MGHYAGYRERWGTDQARIGARRVSQVRKEEWLEAPTQLPVKGQWWSNTATHLEWRSGGGGGRTGRDSLVTHGAVLGALRAPH